MKKQILSEQFLRMQKLAGILKEEKGANYTIELLVPTVYYNSDTGVFTDYRNLDYTDDELEDNDQEFFDKGPSISKFTDGEELRKTMFEDDKEAAMAAAKNFPGLFKVI